jgi:hypothetical protein
LFLCPQSSHKTQGDHNKRRDRVPFSSFLEAPLK